MPELSVIIPLYNAENYIEACISSVLGQSWKDMEVIVVDDGSTDNSLAICEKIGAQDERIQIITKSHEGLVRTRKTGLEAAKGNYVTFVDADDWMDLDAYEHLVSNLTTHHADLIAYGLVEEYKDKSIKQTNSVPAGFYSRREMENQIYPYMLCNMEFFKYGILPNLVCKLAKRELFLQAQQSVDDLVDIGEDVDCTCHMFMYASNILVTNDTPYHYRKHQNSMMWKETTIDKTKILFHDLDSLFRSHVLYENFRRQLNYYMLFILSLKHFDKMIKNLAIGKKIKHKRLALYGAGGFGQEVYRVFNANSNVFLKVWVDKRDGYYREQGFAVQPVELLKDMEYDILFIAILNNRLCETIKSELIDKGIREDVIFYINPSVEMINLVNEILEET